MHLFKECSLAYSFADSIGTGEIFLIKMLVEMGGDGTGNADASGQGHSACWCLPLHLGRSNKLRLTSI